MIGVTSESALRQKTFNSNYGLGEIELTAPGGDPLQTVPIQFNGMTLNVGQNLTTWSSRAMPAPSRTDGGGGYQNQFGTSAAAPYVSGVAALVVSTFGEEQQVGRGPDVVAAVSGRSSFAPRRRSRARPIPTSAS